MLIRYLRLGLHAEYDVVVCCDEAPNAFSIQLQNMTSQLTSLMSDIAEHILSDSVTDEVEFEPEDPCLVKHEESWFRGLVLKVEEEKYKVSTNFICFCCSFLVGFDI